MQTDRLPARRGLSAAATALTALTAIAGAILGLQAPNAVADNLGRAAGHAERQSRVK